jgi:MFS family permease
MTPQVKPTGRETSPMPPRVPGYTWWVLGMLTATYTLSFIDRQILGFLVTPIKRDLQISDTRVALLGGLAFALFYTFLGLPLGRYADSGNRKNLASMSVLIWSFFTSACAAARSFFSLFLARMGVGIGEAGLAPAAYSLIADYFPKERLGLALSIYYFGNILGSALAQIVGGSVVGAVSRTPEITVPILGTIASWRLTFLVLGVPGILFSILVFSLREPVRRNLAKGAASFTLAEAIAEVRVRWQSVAGISVGFVFQAACNYGFMQWATAFFQRVHGWQLQQIGPRLGSVVLVSGCAGLYFGGWLCDRWLRNGIIEAPLRVCFPCAIGMGILFPIAMMASTGEAALAWIFAGLFFMAMPMGTAAAALQFIFPNQVRGQVTAMYLFVLNLGALTLGPLVPALFNDYVFHDEKAIGTSLALTIGIASVLMLIIIGLTIKPYRRHYREMHP